MPSFTPNMGLTKQYEAENYDVNIVNANLDIIDSFPYIVESGVTTAYMSNANATTAQYKKIDWYYKKYSDGTLEAHTVAQITGLKCNDKQKQDGTWRSPYIRFYYPSLGQKTIFHRNAFVSQADDTSNTVWISDVSSPGDGSDNANYESVRCVATVQETTAIDKNFYLSFKATW